MLSPRQPDSLRLLYLQGLRRLVIADLRTAWEKARGVVMAEVQRAARLDVEHDASSRLDARPRGGNIGRIRGALDDARATFDKAQARRDLDAYARGIADRAAKGHMDDLRRQVVSATGYDLTAEPRDKTALLRGWARENVRLIKTIPSRFFTEVRALAVDAVERGRDPAVVARELQERFGVAQSRAALIAYDQIGKLYGQLQEARQTAMGVTHYLWRETFPAHPRPEHVARHGMRFAWAAPPPDGHPGTAIRCSCFADPDLSALRGALEETRFDPRKNAAPRLAVPPEVAGAGSGSAPGVTVAIPATVASPALTPEQAALVRLRAALGPALDVRDTDEPRVQEHIRNLDRIPQPVLAALADQGVRVYIGAAGVPSLDGNRDLSGVQPRGWQRGTWDDAAGSYAASRRTVSAGVGRGWSVSGSVALHEVGHALADVRGLNYSPDLAMHHARLFDRLSPYLQQGGPAGPAGCEELVAEGLALYWSRGLAAVAREFDPAFARWVAEQSEITGRQGAEALRARVR